MTRCCARFAQRRCGISRLIDSLPIDDGGSHQPVAVEGQPVVPMADQPEVDVRMISPGYLHAMRVPVLRGRDLNDADLAAGRSGVHQRIHGEALLAQ